MAGASPKNPSTLIFWNDLENDERLRTCSLAAKGLWDHHMLPIAARSVEPGVVLIGDHPCKVAGDLPKLLARVAGESPDVIAELLRELVDSGAASVDEHGRAYNRRMVREEAIRKARSAAGKRGAEATNAANLDRRQKSGKHPGKSNGDEGGKQSGKDGGKQSGKKSDVHHAKNGGNIGENGGDTEWESRQNSSNSAGKANGAHAGDLFGKTAPSSIFKLQASSESDDGESFTDRSFVGGADASAKRSPEAEVVDLWNQTAESLNAELGRTEWPRAQKLTGTRRKQIRQRLRDAGNIEGIKTALARARADPWARGETQRPPDHANWRFNFDYFIKEKTFTQIMEKPDDDPRRSARQSSHEQQRQALAEWSREGDR